ncbi:YlaH-like family protein [Rummeliibacillus pycnus]|uniref:YlaH-like family protein n=1 Tax=Rummeliibacillus pycnus TaxID=101070 RepID=UPI001FE66910|nr:YlaH-like family protein [Rummeliibacillus pycnus]
MLFKSGLTFKLNFMQVATSTSTDGHDQVFNRMSGVARYIYENSPSYSVAGYILLAVIFVLTAIVYHLGFARAALKKWQTAVIYVFLFLGCIILTFLAFFLPMVEGLIVAALVLIIYKVRLRRDKKREAAS